MSLRRIVILGVVVSALGATECGEPSGHLLENGSLDRWCAEGPCGWQVDGSVIAVSTWHPLDLGAKLQEASTLEQWVYNPEPALWSRCLEVKALVDVPTNGALWLDLDFRADGSVEWSTQLAGRDWAEEVRETKIPAWFGPLRVVLRSEGAGGGALGDLRLVQRRGGCSDDGVDVPSMLGDPCSSETACPDPGVCEQVPDAHHSEDSWWPESTCSECTYASCGSGLVCGLVWADDPYPYRTCEPAFAASMGEVCAVDEECVSGTCCQGRCSECCVPGGADSCEQGTCADRRVSRTEGDGYLAHMCERGPRSTGEACLADDDCAAGRCVGEGLGACSDSGRPCSSDTDCPDREGVCSLVGVAHGVCE